MLSIEPFVSRHFQDNYSTYGNPITDLRVNCPFCEGRYGTQDTSHKLHVSINKHVCHCFRCGYKNSWVGLVQSLTGLSYAHALGELYVKPRISRFDNITGDMYAKTVLSCVGLPIDFKLILSNNMLRFNSSNLAKVAYIYLNKRGFNDNTIQHYNLGVSEEIGFRVVIPIEEDYWQARSVYDFVQPKYMSPKVENRHYIFNSTALKTYSEIVICEGAFSAMAVGWNAVATLSHNITTEQMSRLKDSQVKHFILASEPGFLRNSMANASQLTRAGKRVTIWDYQTGDPAEPGEMVVIEYDLHNRLKALLYN